MRAKWIMRGLAGAAIGLAVSGTANADGKPIRIMVLNDQTGVSSGASGLGSVRAAKLAVEDFGGSIDGSPIEVVAIDHQTKVDIASAAARKAYDQDGVDAIFDIANSAASLAVQEIARERGKIVVHVGSAVSDLYGKACSPTGALWLYDTYSLGRGLTGAVFAEGGASWYFLTADYAFGKAIETEVSSTLKALGGQVLGSVRHPMGTQDFSSFLLQAQGAQPKVIGLLNTGEDVLNSLKQAQEFGMTGNTKFATFIFYTQMMKAAGPEFGKGLQYLSGYYWDKDDGSRAFAKRYAAVSNGAMPSEPNAGGLQRGSSLPARRAGQQKPRRPDGDAADESDASRRFLRTGNHHPCRWPADERPVSGRRERQGGDARAVGCPEGHPNGQGGRYHSAHRRRRLHTSGRPAFMIRRSGGRAGHPVGFRPGPSKTPLRIFRIPCQASSC